MDDLPAKTLRTRAARWKSGPHLRTLAVLALVAAALIGGVVLMWQTIDTERNQRAQAARTNAVMLALRDVSRTATNGETGQRGFFITLDRRYLSPYLVAREQYRPALARLRNLMGDGITPRQRDLLDQIDRLNEAKFAEMGDTVGQIDAGNLQEARRRILTDEGQDVMERLRRAIAELEELELRSFQEARDRATESERLILPILVALSGFIVMALALGLTQVIRTADAEARAANAASLARARDRADLLARELNHRVKNLFAVVLAIVKMTGRGAPEAKPTVDKISERIHALLMAHEVTQGTSAQASARLSDLVATTLKPYRSADNACEIGGPEIDLPERAVVSLGLVLHELTTNAVKYGAWASPGGLLSVRWNTDGAHLRLDWAEQRGPSAGPAPEQGAAGFGSTLIDGSARQLGGTIRRDFSATGLIVTIDCPLGE
jgi:two-component sensor histidine kinase/CHASE3 domain sensor protein